MKRFVMILIVFSVLFCGFTANAEETDLKDYYLADEKIEDYVPDETREMLESIGLDYLNADSFKNLSFKTAAETFLGLFGNKRSGAVMNGLFIISVVLISSAVSGINNKTLLNNLNTVDYVTSIVIICAVSAELLNFINLIDKSVKSCSVIMLTVFPIIGVILFSMGKASTAAVSSTTLLLLPEMITQILQAVVIPLIKISCAIGICSSTAPNLKISKLTEIFRKVALWVLTLSLSVFMFVFSTQTIIAISADNVTSKTAKFIVSTAVPLVGSAVSEAITTITSCFSVLKSTVSVYSVIAVIFVFLPIVIELLLWKLSIFTGSATAQLVGNESVSNILDGINKTLSFFLAVIISVVIMFIYSVTLLTVGAKSI